MHGIYRSGLKSALMQTIISHAKAHISYINQRIKCFNANLNNLSNHNPLPFGTRIQGVSQKLAIILFQETPNVMRIKYLP